MATRETRQGMATRRSFLFRIVGTASLLLAGRSAFAGDWPQWRGPGRNGVSDETGWLTQWPVGGPNRGGFLGRGSRR